MMTPAKFLGILLAVFASLTAFAQQDEGEFYGEYSYDVPLNRLGDSYTSHVKEWYGNLFSPEQFDTIYYGLVNAVRSGKLRAKRKYSDTAFANPLQGFGFLVTSQQIEEMDYEGNFLGTRIMIDTLRAGNVDALRFHEEWYYDKQSNVMTKKVKGISILTDLDGYSERIFIETAQKKGNTSGTTLSNQFTKPYFTNYWEHHAVTRYFVNALLSSPHFASAVRDTVYPFDKTVEAKNIPAIKDSIFKCYAFSFLEDWHIDHETWSFTKTVKALAFRKLSTDSRYTSYKAAFAFSPYQPVTFIKDRIVYRNAQPETFLPASMYDDSIPPVAQATDAFSNVFLKSVLNNKTKAFDYLHASPLSSQQVLERLIIPNDNRVDTNMFLDGLMTSESLIIDLDSQRISRNPVSLTLCQFNSGKYFYVQKFMVQVASDKQTMLPANKQLENVSSTIRLRDIPYLDKNTVCNQGYYQMNEANTYSYPIHENYSFFYTLIDYATKGKIKLYRADSDAILTLTELEKMCDTLSYPCIESALPEWPLTISKITTREDWYLDKESLRIYIDVKECAFWTETENGPRAPLFRWKLNPYSRTTK